MSKKHRESLLKYEKHERSLGLQFIYSFSDKIDNYEFTPPHSKSFYDGWYSTITSPDSSVCFEIKVRNFPLFKYPDYILQVDKLKNLLKLVKKGHQVKYMNFFKNDAGFYDCVVFDINKRVPGWKKNGIKSEKMLMNEATYKNDNKKVFKDVVMLKFNEEIDTMITRTQWQ